MFFDGNFFWFLMGIIFVVIAAAFKAHADEKGWVVSWWKALLGLIWYAIFALSFYAFGTLLGENENGAAWKLLAFGLFIAIVLGIGLWRLFTAKSKIVS